MTSTWRTVSRGQRRGNRETVGRNRKTPRTTKTVKYLNHKAAGDKPRRFVSEAGSLQRQGKNLINYYSIVKCYQNQTQY